MKRLQNRIAVSGNTLPFMIVYAILVWLLKGVIEHNWWLQIICFFTTVYLFVELSNGNALLRVRSRMVSACFIALSCAANFLFPSLSGSILQLLMIGALIILFRTYQDPTAVGKVFYAFVLIGLASFTYVHILYAVPLIWILMSTQLLALNGRLLLASVIGLLTPYWIGAIWLLFQRDTAPLLDHLSQLGNIGELAHGYATLALPQVTLFAVILILAGAGIVHFWIYGFEDKIRIRLLYGFFTVMVITASVCLLILPAHYDELMRLLIIFASPLIAHLFTFTSTRMSNILFVASMVIIVALTIIGIWNSSLTF